MENEEKTQMDLLKERIPYDEDIFGSEENYAQVLQDLLDDSKNIALETLFPFEDFSEYKLPKQYYNWQIRCCIELFNLAGKMGITSYTENRLSWTRLTDGLSNSLMSKLISKVGIPKGE